MSREEHGTSSSDDPPPSRVAALTGRVVDRVARSRPLRLAGLGAAALALGVGIVVDGDLPDAAPAPAPTASAPAPSPAQDVVDPDLPLDTGLVSEVIGDGREGGDLTHVYATVLVVNRGGVDRRIEQVRLVGLGTATLDRPADVPLRPGDMLSLQATITADCEALYDRPVQVVVTERAPDGSRSQLRTRPAGRTPFTAALDPMCPQVVPGLHVAVVAAQSLPGGAATVRLVNHGNLSALVTPRATPDAGRLRLSADPPLPFDLGPGQSVVATLDVRAADGTDGCPAAAPKAAADALFLEAETPYGFTEVTGFPTATLRTAVARYVTTAGCPVR